MVCTLGLGLCVGIGVGGGGGSGGVVPMGNVAVGDEAAKPGLFADVSWVCGITSDVGVKEVARSVDTASVAATAGVEPISSTLQADNSAHNTIIPW